MKLKDQISLLATIPIVGLMIVSLYLVVAQAVAFLAAIETRSHVSDIETLSELVHVLQVERGQSAGFVASGGKNFADTLPGMRERVDAVEARLPEISPELRRQITQLAQMRSQIDQLEITVPEFVGKYTAMIREALTLAEELLLSQQDPVIVRVGSGLASLAEAKEAAGRERAVGAGGFGTARFGKDQYQAFVGFGAIQKSLLQIARKEFGAVVEGVDFAKGLDESGLAELRQAVFDAGPGAEISGITAQEWFARSTAWIDHLRVDELSALSAVKALANRAALWGSALLCLALLVSAIAILSTLYVARFVKRSFENAIGAFGRALERIGNGDFENRQANKDEITEFGHLFIALDRTKDDLRAAAEAIERSKREQSKTERDRASVIGSLDNALAQLATGNLTSKIHEQFPREFEDLRVSYNAAIKQLASAMRSVGSSIDTLNHSSDQMLQSSNSLSERTTSQAAALEETTAALAQLSKIVGDSAREAHNASGITNQLREDAAEGGRRVDEVVQAMQQIDASAKKMTTMVGMIEDIAFQTNLLALNAGVEAARAGEFGKGFAVVAKEVRALSVRATDTTNEISALIESSTRITASGVALVERAGEAFSSVSEGVENSSKAVEKIAADAEEQSKNIDGIKDSMLELDQVTQRNATMVEDSMAVSAQLGDQTETLGKLIGQFQLQAEHDGGFDQSQEAA